MTGCVHVFKGWVLVLTLFCHSLCLLAAMKQAASATRSHRQAILSHLRPETTDPANGGLEP